MNKKQWEIASGKRPVAAEAQSWAGLFLAGEPTSAERAAFESWLNASSDHRREFEKAKRAWDALGASDRIVEWTNEVVPSESVAHKRAATSRRRWLVSGVAAAAVAIFVAGPPLYWALAPAPAEPVRYAAGIAERKTVELEDGTILTLGGASAVSVAFTDSSRDVRLLRGSVFFDVARDESRPLTVDVANSKVRVLGTAFSVRLGIKDISVAVSHGAVSVGAASREAEAGARSIAALTAGRRAVIGLTGEIVYETDADLQTELSWIEGYLAYESAPLSEVVADINRYRVKQVRIDDPAVADFKITVSFRDDQSDQFLAGLPAAYAVTVVDLPEATVIRANR